MKENKFQKRLYNLYINRLRKKNLNKNVSIISNNCIGGILYHDLGLKFNSPTINTLIYGRDFISFCNNLEKFLNCELEFDENSKDYPIGILDCKEESIEKIHLHFLHEKSFTKAKEDWNRRKIRFNKNNYIIIYEHFNKNGDDVVYDFSNLKHPYKIVFTHKKFKNIPCSYYSYACRKEKSFGKITKYRNGLSGKRNFYKSQIIKLINSCNS